MKYTIYRNLELEIKKSRLKLDDLSELTNICRTSLIQKKKGEFDFTLNECLQIKRILNYQGSIEELFKIDDSLKMINNSLLRGGDYNE